MLAKPPEWNVLCVRTGREFIVRDALAEAGVESLVPVGTRYRRVGRHRRRVKTAEALLPGYVPVQGQMPPRGAAKPLWRHVFGYLLGPDGEAATLSVADLAHIEAMGSGERRIDPTFQPGQCCEVVAGLLAGSLVRVVAVLGERVVIEADAAGTVSVPATCLAA